RTEKNRPLEARLPALQGGNTGAAGRVPHHRNGIGVTAKILDVVNDPLDGCFLIKQAGVVGGAGKMKPAKCRQTVVGRDHDNVAALCKLSTGIPISGTAAALPSPPMQPNQHGPLAA